MPFTHDQFLDVFGRYNQALWPVVVALWLVSAAAVLWLLRAGSAASRFIAALLSFHWAWSALAYHAAFFSAINPGAWLFAALFLFEAGCVLWLGVVTARLRFSNGRSARHVAGYALVVYALAYPGLSVLSGHTWPRAPMFAVPCPTTLLTAGLLLVADSASLWLACVVPIIWASVAGSAAILLGIPADFALFVAAAALASRVAALAVAGRKRAQACDKAQT
jgi:hypothetical protein